MSVICGSINDYKSVMTTNAPVTLPSVNSFLETGTLSLTKPASNPNPYYISFVQNGNTNLLCNTVAIGGASGANIAFPQPGVYQVSMNFQMTYSYQTGAGVNYNVKVCLNKSPDVAVLSFTPGGGSITNVAIPTLYTLVSATTQGQATNYSLTANYNTTTISSGAYGQTNANFTLSFVINCPSGNDGFNFLVTDSYNGNMGIAFTGNYALQLLGVQYP